MLPLLDLNPQDFFTVGSFTTLAGSASMVYIICGTVQSIFNFSPKWLALAVSMAVSVLAAYIGFIVLQNTDSKALSTDQKLYLDHPGIGYVLALLNGFLIYVTATGGNQLLANVNQEGAAPGAPGGPGTTNTDPNRRGMAAPAIPRRRFNTNWWAS